MLVADGFKIGQSARWISEAEDFDNYSIVADAYIEAALNDSLSLRVAAVNRYDNTPASGRDSNDFTLTSGIAVKF